MDSDDEDEPLPWPAASSPADDAGSMDEALPSASGSSGMVLEEALADDVDDDDDDDDDKDVAEAPFEIADHTTVTAWERLVAALEDLLRRWKLDAPNGVLPDTAHAASIAYDGQPYELQYHHHHHHHHHHHRASASAAPAAPSVGPVPAVLQRHFGDRTTDFAQDGHVLAQWFGVRALLVLVPAEERVLTVVGPDLARTLLGALRVAAANTHCEVPCFVKVDGAAKQHYRGFLVSSTDGVDAQLATTSVDHLEPDQAALTTLSGLAKLLIAKLPGAGVGNLASLDWTCAVQFQYSLSWMHEDWRGPAPIPEPPEAYLGWGPRTDPVLQLQVGPTWPTYPSELIADDTVFSGLDPGSAPDWSLRRRLRPRVACPLASLLDDLVAAVAPSSERAEVADGQVDAEAMLATGEAGRPGRDGAPPPLVSIVHTAVRSVMQARSGGLVGLAASLADGVAAAAAGNSLGPMPSPEERELLWAQLFGDPTAGGSGGGTGTAPGERIARAAPFGSITWFLALHLARELVGYPNHWTARLAVVWNDVVSQCRQHWDDRQLLARLDVDPPDVRRPLLHQKLQMLQYCIQRSRDADAAARAPPLLPPRLQVAATDDADDADDVFFDTHESAASASGDLAAAAADAAATTSDGWDVNLDLEIDPPGPASTTAAPPRPLPTTAPRGIKSVLAGVMLRQHPSVPVYVPVTQEPGPMTEDAMDERVRQLEALGETAEGAHARAKLQSASLLSDMAAFKAANPGSVLEDFVRWHSPNDWIVDAGADSGRLSTRMADTANTWHTLWESTRPASVDEQAPLFHIEAEAEKVLHYLTTISADALIQQLLPTVFQAAYDSLAVHADLRELPPVHAQLQRLREAMLDVPWDQPLDASKRATNALHALVAALRRTELMVAVAASFLHKLPAHPALVARLLDAPQTDADTVAERDACFELLDARAADWAPERKVLVLRLVFPQPTPDARPQLHRLQAIIRGESELRIAEVLSSDALYH